MSESISPNPETPEENGANGDRRNFLSRSAIMIALLALAGGEGVADAAAVDFKGPITLTPTEVPTMNMVLNSFIKAGSVDPKNPSLLKLSKGAQGALTSLTTQDLTTLRAAQSIIQGHLSLPNAADNNGTIGM
jgi:hypothetical protein